MRTEYLDTDLSHSPASHRRSPRSVTSLTDHFCKSLGLGNPFHQHHNFFFHSWIAGQLFTNQLLNPLVKLHIISVEQEKKK